jgi:hypothetical protein
MSYGSTHIAPSIIAPPPAAEHRQGDHTSWLFLSLYLLLFAFFIVLNSFSSFDQGRRDAVISSVLDAFATVISPGEDTKLGGFIGAENQARRFQDAVTDIFETSIPLNNLRVVVPGSRMDVDVPTQAWFDGDTVVVRDPLPMLDRIVATVSSPPEGLAYEMVLIAQVPAEPDEALPRVMTTEIARVGNVARALDTKGMPPYAMSIGMERGDPRFIRVVFLAVEEQASVRAGLPIGGESPGGQPQ